MADAAGVHCRCKAHRRRSRCEREFWAERSDLPCQTCPAPAAPGGKCAAVSQSRVRAMENN